MRRYVLLAFAAATLFAPPARANDSSTIDCRPETGFGPPPSVYVCRNPQGPGPLDDCYRAGVAVPLPVGPITYTGCR